jgi:hypothetical protein
MQVWNQRIEYVGMQQKMELKAISLNADSISRRTAYIEERMMDQDCSRWGVGGGGPTIEEEE